MTAPGALDLGILGDPLGHTLSPRLHTYALAHYGLAGCYRALPTPPDALPAAVAAMRERPMHGLNVTLPHKVAVIAHLDGLTERARGVGAVNTLFWEGRRLLGDNTDVAGFLRQAEGIALAGAAAAILGSGGSARAVAWALAEAGAREVTVFSRRPGAALEWVEALARRWPEVRWRTAHWDCLASLLRHVEVVVNATPLGMAPQTQGSPLGEAELAVLPERSALLDLVYRPAPTRLLSLAQARGLEARSGLAMLAAQAAVSFERWTGVTGAAGVFDAALAALTAEPGS